MWCARPIVFSKAALAREQPVTGVNLVQGAMQTTKSKSLALQGISGKYFLFLQKNNISFVFINLFSYSHLKCFILTENKCFLYTALFIY